MSVMPKLKAQKGGPRRTLFSRRAWSLEKRPCGSSSKKDPEVDTQLKGDWIVGVLVEEYERILVRNFYRDLLTPTLNPKP